MFARRISIMTLLVAAWAVSPAGAEPPKAADFHGQPLSMSPGEKAQVTLFGVKAEGSKFVYVLDRSGSMGGPGGKALAAAKAELVTSLDSIDSVQQFQIIFYNERPRIFNPSGQEGRLAFGTAGNKTQAKSFIDSISADGGTDHEAALMAAVRMRPDVIFLLTDGDDPQLTAQQLRAPRSPGRRDHHQHDPIRQTPQGKAENFMVKLARQSGGQHAYVDVSTLKTGER